MSYTLPGDVARCSGWASRPECADCLRRTSPPAHTDRVVYTAPPEPEFS